MAPRDDDLLSTAELLRATGLSKSTVQRAKRDGLLTSVPETEGTRYRWREVRTAKLYSHMAVVAWLTKRHPALAKRFDDTIQEGIERNLISGAGTTLSYDERAIVERAVLDNGYSGIEAPSAPPPPAQAHPEAAPPAESATAEASAAEATTEDPARVASSCREPRTDGATTSQASLPEEAPAAEARSTEAQVASTQNPGRVPPPGCDRKTILGRWVWGELLHPAEFPAEFWDTQSPPPFVPPVGVFRYDVLKPLLGRSVCWRAAGFELGEDGSVDAVAGRTALVRAEVYEEANRHWDRLKLAWEECWESRWRLRGAGQLPTV